MAVIPLRYSLQFRGYATPIGPHVYDVRAGAPGSTLVTTIADDRLNGQIQAADGDEALLESRLVIDESGLVEVTGRILIGQDNVLRFCTLGAGRIGAGPSQHLRQGCVVCAVSGGEGQFHEAQGRIASTLVLSDTGEITDNQLGLLFIAHDEEPGRRRLESLRIDGKSLTT